MSLAEKFIGQKVIVRTYAAGVHYGTLTKIDGDEVLLESTRRIWYWNKAFTLSQVAEDGVGQDSKLSIVIPEIFVREAIEIIPVSTKSSSIIESIKGHAV